MAKIKDKFTLLGDLIKEIRDVKTRLTKLVKFKESEKFYDLRILLNSRDFSREMKAINNN